MNSSSFLLALLGATFGGTIIFLFNAVKTRIDYFASRYEEICKQILQIADLSSEYWMTIGPRASCQSVDAEALRRELKIQEAKIRGIQHLIILNDAQLRSELPKSARGELKKCLPKFIDTLSGSDFGSRVDAVNEQKSRLVQTLASELVTHIRQGLRDRVSLSFWLKRLFRCG